MRTRASGVSNSSGCGPTPRRCPSIRWGAMRCRSSGPTDTTRGFMGTTSCGTLKRPETMKIDPRFLEGLHLFNEKEYFECHEVIEDLWLDTPSDDKWRDLYKGVIQAAASLYQHDRS